jgi:hypothetical protein
MAAGKVALTANAGIKHAGRFSGVKKIRPRIRWVEMFMVK